MMWGKAKAKPSVIEFREPVPHERCTFENIRVLQPNRLNSGQWDKQIAHSGKDLVIKDSSGRIYVIGIDVFNEKYDVIEPIQSSSRTQTPAPSMKSEKQ